MSEIKEEIYHILDLERTVKTGIAHYWKSGGMGYVTDPEQAGFFALSIAKRICEDDLDQRSVMISAHVIKKIIDKQ